MRGCEDDTVACGLVWLQPCMYISMCMWLRTASSRDYVRRVSLRPGMGRAAYKQSAVADRSWRH